MLLAIILIALVLVLLAYSLGCTCTCNSAGSIVINGMRYSICDNPFHNMKYTKLLVLPGTDICLVQNTSEVPCCITTSLYTYRVYGTSSTIGNHTLIGTLLPEYGTLRQSSEALPIGATLLISRSRIDKTQLRTYIPQDVIGCWSILNSSSSCISSSNRQLCNLECAYYSRYPREVCPSLLVKDEVIALAQFNSACYILDNSEYAVTPVQYGPEVVYARKQE